MARIAAAVNNMEPLTNVMNSIAATTCRLLGYDFGAVLLVNDQESRLLIRGSHGLSSDYVAIINSKKPIRLGEGPFGEGPSSRAFRTREPVIVHDAKEDPVIGPWAGVASEQGYRSLVAVPLVVSGRAIGTLNCYTRGVHDFSQDELLLLTTVANQAAIAIESARLREQERATIARLERARRSLETQAGILERSEEIHSNLTRAVLEGAGLGAIAEALARILQGSVVIDDATGEVLARAPSGSFAPALPAAVIEDSDVSQLLTTIVEAQQPCELSEADHPAFVNRTFLAPVVISKELVARLWVLGAKTELETLERRALEHGATVVALEMLKQRIANEVETRLRGSLLDDLLAGSDQRTLRRRARQLGHDIRGRHAALVIGLDAPASRKASGLRLQLQRNHQLPSMVSSVVRRSHVDGLMGERDGRVVILLAEGTDTGPGSAVELADAIRAEVRGSLRDGSATVAIGPWVNDPPEFLGSYSIAVGAFQLSQRFGHRDRTVTLEELGVYGLLFSVGRLEELASFSSRTLEPLLTYDRRKRTNLVPTLRAYLAHSCHSAQAATALFVHPNTVAYRIRRIESLLGVDLGRSDSLLQLQLALIVDDVVAARNGVSSPARG